MPIFEYHKVFLLVVPTNAGAVCCYQTFDIADGTYFKKNYNTRQLIDYRF